MSQKVTRMIATPMSLNVESPRCTDLNKLFLMVILLSNKQYQSDYHSGGAALGPGKVEIWS